MSSSAAADSVKPCSSAPSGVITSRSAPGTCPPDEGSAFHSSGPRRMVTGGAAALTAGSRLWVFERESKVWATWFCR